MRIVTPYGRSFTESTGNGGKSERKLRLKARRDDGTGLETDAGEADIPAFVETDPRALIAAWISVIDKIYRKPKPGKRPSRPQFEARDKLGKACWELLRADDAFSRLQGSPEHGRYETLWKAKLHPYPWRKANGEKNFDKDAGKDFDDTQWARAFGAHPESKCDVDRVSELIEEHLHTRRCTMAGKPEQRRVKQGLIQKRAQSIRGNTLAGHMRPLLSGDARQESGRNEGGCTVPSVSRLRQRLDDLTDPETPWTKADIDAFCEHGDVVAAIHAKNAKLENVKKSFERRHIWSSEAVPLIFDHYGKQFAREGGKGCMTRREIVASGQGGLLALYDAVRGYYGRMLKRTQKDGKTRKLGGTLPRTTGELLSLLGNMEKNRVTSDLIRLGRVLYYEYGADYHKAENLKPDDWERCLASRYWTSAGQAEIKRTEAFVRVWRNAIAQASRSLLNWTDPDHKRMMKAKDGEKQEEDDILSGDNIALMKDGDCLDMCHARAQLPILFGRDAGLFTDAGPDGKDKKLVDSCFIALSLARIARNEIVHFRGRNAFVKALEKLENPPSKKQGVSLFEDCDVDGIKALHANDLVRRRERFVRECEGAQLHRFASADALAALIGALAGAEQGDLALPAYNKLLRGLHDLEKSVDDGGESYVCNGLLRLPEPASETRLKQPFLLAAFVGSRLVYERLFLPWLAGQKADRLNGWIETAQRRATERARATAADKDSHAMVEAIEGRAASIMRLKPGQHLKDLFEDLAHETATEMRVQRGYQSDGEQARKQMKWIEAFKHHIVGQAFLTFLETPGAGRAFNWLLKLDETSPCDDKAVMPGTDDLSLKDGEAGAEPAWVANLYYLLHMIPVDDVSQLLHQFKKWQVLEAKGEAGAAPGASRASAADDVEVTHLMDTLSLYIDMADDKYVWPQQGTSGAPEGGSPDIGLAAARGFYESDEAFDLAFPRQKNEDLQRLAATRRGIRQIMRFGHLDFLKRQLGKEGEQDRKEPGGEGGRAGVLAPITLEQVEQVQRLASDGETGIDAMQAEKERLHEAAVRAARVENPGDFNHEDFTLKDFERYKALVADISAYRFEAETVRLTFLVRYHRLMMQVLARLVDYSGLWERDRIFMMLALMKLHGVEDRGLRKQLRKLKLDEEFSAGGTAFLPACACMSIAPHASTSPKEKARFDADRKTRNDLAHFNILKREAGRLNLTDQINRVRQMMAYDRKLKNAVSKSVIEMLAREGFALRWRMGTGRETGVHCLRAAQITPRTIEHLKAWRAAEMRRQKDEFKREVNASQGSKEEKKACKGAATEARKWEFEYGNFSCSEALKSDKLVTAVADLFGGQIRHPNVPARPSGKPKPGNHGGHGGKGGHSGKGKGGHHGKGRGGKGRHFKRQGRR